MQVDLSKINLEEFNVSPHIIAGDECFLVTPKHVGAKWNTNNLWQRSSVWTKDGRPVSLSFPKFFNWGERPEIQPPPTSLEDCELIEKLDGSLLAVSYYKGQLIARTRGTVDASKLENGYEIEVLKAKYPLAFSQRGYETWGCTYIFEWVSSANRIVIDYGIEPDIYFIGCVDHADYSLLGQKYLDELANVLGVKRPRRYSFNTIPEMVAGVEAFKGVEGICVYYNRGQSIRKLKGIEYLSRHRFKEHATLENTIDLYFAYDQPDYETFMAKLTEAFDYECANMVLGYASQICDAMKEVNEIVSSMYGFAEGVRMLSLRKQQAEKVLQAYGNTNRASFVFKILDGRNIKTDTEILKKLLYQILKN